MSLYRQHILTVNQFDIQTLQRLFSLTDKLQNVAHSKATCRILEGAVLANLFFEASTRTRLSFGAAFQRLGGSVLDTTGFTFSSIAKGESLADTSRVISGYADVIVLRHPDTGSVAEFAKDARVPVINGGDGIGEHPTQALLDLYTIERELQSRGKVPDNLTVMLFGDLKHGRTIHSLIQLLILYPRIHFKLLSPSSLKLPTEYLDKISNNGHTFSEHTKLSDAINNADVLYTTRIQKERFEDKSLAESYAEDMHVRLDNINPYAKDDLIILHPLPRDSRIEANDLSVDLDNDPRLAIFKQSDNGIAVRMALFIEIMGLADKIDDYIKPAVWANASSLH